MKKNISYFIRLLICISFLGIFSASNAYTVENSAESGIAVNIEYAKNNSEVWAVVWLDIANEYYTYAPSDKVDDSIRPVVLSITGASGALPTRYPQGIERRDYYDVSKLILSYSSKVPLFVNLGDAKANTEYNGVLSLLLCSTSRCVPHTLDINLDIPEHIPALNEQSYFNVWKNSVLRDLQLPKALGLGTIDTVSSEASKTTNYTWAFAPRVFAEELEVTGLGKAILLGFLSGIILNLMPCVFPVLTLKASSFLLARQEMQDDNFADFRIQNLLFAAGMLSLFLILALFLGTAGFIWGQFYQNNMFVAFMVVLIFSLSLSMFGLFTLPVIDLKAQSVKSPKAQSFITGMVTTLLATPCSGPLLGGVLSWAFTQPLSILVLVFVSVGTGMSTPYLILAYKPSLAKFLPRPGAWMGIIERLVAFFLLATALYLFSILPADVHVNMLIGLLLVAFAAWLWGHFGGLSAPRIRRHALGLGFLLCMALVVFYGTKLPEENIEWHNFDAATFEADLGKVPMLVEFTADWCPNCKFVEKTVLTPDFLEKIKEQYNLKLIKVDITRPHAEAESLLQALESNSIPLTAIFTKGLQASSPIVLRDIYTQEMLGQALEKAF